MVKKIDIKPAVLDSGTTVSVQILKYIDGELSEDNTYTFDANDLEVSRASSNTYVAKIVFGTAYTEWIDGSTTQCFFDGVVCSPNDAYTLAGLVEADITAYATGGGGGSYTFPANGGNIAYVSTGGNDGTGAVGNISKPFETVDAAIAAFNSANPATLVILSSAAAQVIDAYDYSTDPYDLSIQVLGPVELTLGGTGSCSFGKLSLKSAWDVNVNTQLIFSTDEYMDVSCNTFRVEDSSNGVFAFTGTINCNYFIVEDNANINIDVDTINWHTGMSIGVIGGVNYNAINPWEYHALLNQVDTDPPTAVVLKNSLGDVLTYGYVNPGEYTITSPGSKFVLNNTAVYFGAGRSDGGGLTTLGTTAALAVDEINFAVYSPFSFAFANDQLVNTPINIKVYPAKY
jgi:hypothetical protein